MSKLGSQPVSKMTFRMHLLSSVLGGLAANSYYSRIAASPLDGTPTCPRGTKMPWHEAILSDAEKITDAMIERLEAE